ncbi:MAG: NAD(P)-binding domain-containing protein, partial [Pseudomonadota bacterium]
IVRPDGGVLGRNTDAFGFMESLRESAPRWRADAGAAVVLGAGGAARAVVAALLEAGVSEIRVVNRTVERARELARAMAPATKGAVVARPWAERAAALAGAALVVNTTSLGMQGQPPLDLDLAPLPATATVADIVYAPLETPLLKAARARGLAGVDGLGMLLHQGRPAFAAWFGIEPQVTPALRAAVLADRAG